MEVGKSTKSILRLRWLVVEIIASGVILGGHLVKSAGLSLKDRKTIICWVLRSMTSATRLALNFALDFLSTT